MTSLSLFTVTYHRDLARFSLQRDALEALGCTLPHRVVVHSEDLALFKSQMGQSRVEWIASGDVLPPEVEQTRRRISGWPDAYRRARRSLAKRLGWFPDASMDGWHVQQIVKLSMPARSPEEIQVCLDSDVIPTRAPALADYLCPSGKLALRRISGVPQAHWVRAAESLLGLAPEEPLRTNHVVWPFAFHRQTLLRLHQTLEDRHQKPWWAACLGQRPTLLSEYTVYGAAVERLFNDEHHEQTQLGRFTHAIITEAEHADAPARIRAAFADDEARVLVIQSSRHWPIDPYLPVLRECLGLHGS